MVQTFLPRLAKSSELHRLAEALWKERSPLHKGLPGNSDPHALIQELGVQRFELELKNEDLSAAYHEVWHVLERYTGLYDYGPSAYCTLLTNGRISEANFAAASLMGVERSKLIGASMLDYVEPSHLGDFQAFLREIGKTSSLCKQMEFNLRRADGSLRFVRLNGLCGDFIPDQGRDVKIALVDLTDREKARTALASEKDLALNAFDAAPVFMLMLDMHGRILRINRKAVAWLRYEDEKELAGRNWFAECLPERSSRRDRDRFLDLIRGKTVDPRLRKSQLLCRDGSQRMMAFRDSVLRDAESKIIGIVSVGEDPSGETPPN